ncbi:MAG TPA: hypothetical protein VII75_10365 [Thermoanaerobaculia bacterium]
MASDGHESPQTHDMPSDLMAAKMKILELQLRADLATQISTAIDRERGQLKAYWTLLSRVVVVAAAIVGAALGIIGWQGWKDVVGRVDQKVNDRLDAHLKASPPAKYEKDVERLFDRALITSYSAEIPRRDPADGFSRFPDVPTMVTQDWTRLMTIMCAPDTAEETSRKILGILTYHCGFGQLSNDGVSQVRHLALTEPVPEWLANAPKRRADLLLALATLDDNDSASLVRALLLQNKIPEVQLAALSYIRHLFVLEASSDVERFVAESGLRGDVETAGLQTLAVIAPDSPFVKKFINKLNSDGPLSQVDLIRGVMVVEGLSKLGIDRHVAAYEDVTHRKQLAVSVLASVLKHEYHLEQWNSEVRLVFRTSALENEGIPVATLTSFELDEAIGSIFSDAVKRKDIVAISKIVGHFDVEDTLADQWHFLPHVFFFDGAFQVMPGRKVEFSGTADGIWLTAKKDLVTVHWVDLGGTEQSGLLEAVDDVHFAQGVRIEGAPPWLAGIGQIRGVRR